MYFIRFGCLLLILLLPASPPTAGAADSPTPAPAADSDSLLPAPATNPAPPAADSDSLLPAPGTNAAPVRVPSPPSASARPAPALVPSTTSAAASPTPTPEPLPDTIPPDKPPAQPKESLPSFLLSLVPFPLPSTPSVPDDRFSDKPIPLQSNNFPERPKPIIEIGQNQFLGQGAIASGIRLPTGAVWQPAFLVFGTDRTAIQSFDDGKNRFSEIATRLDIFGNLYLTPTERIVIGFRPLDRDADYTMYSFHPHTVPDTDFNGNVHTLYFQGDFGEIFPNLDPKDTKSLDYGFAVGRQPLRFEDGIMINDDSVDAIGITRSSLFALGASALRTTALFAWGQLNRNDNIKDDSAKLVGLFTTADYRVSTVDVDLAYVNGREGDGFYAGVGATQRFFGHLNTTFRANTSVALDRESPAVSTGTLLFGQFSTTLPHGNDVAYLNTFWGIREYSSAARDPDSGGPLLQTGILYTSQALGRYGAPLGTRADDALGFALGWQHFPNNNPDQQIVVEIGARQSTARPDYFGEPSGPAAAVRFQRKISQHCVIIYDAFVGYPGEGPSWGLRSELLVKF